MARVEAPAPVQEMLDEFKEVVGASFSDPDMIWQIRPRPLRKDALMGRLRALQAQWLGPCIM